MPLFSDFEILYINYKLNIEFDMLFLTFTLPLTTYSYYNILNNIYIIEIAVIFIESVLIMFLLEMKYRTAFLISLTANFFTAVIGLLILGITN